MSTTTAANLGELEAVFPFLRQTSPAARQEITTHGLVKTIPAGATIFWEGDDCTVLALVLAGSVRVYKVGESGREITLYRIEEGESCILTASCILSRTSFPAFAVAETEVRALLAPAAAVRAWVAQDEGWRDYVVGLLARRLSTVIATVEEIAFRRVDARIAGFVLNAAGEDAHLSVTHQEIALELGTAREVVSRILKDLERSGTIALRRGVITVLDRAALQGIAGAV